ncbi:hypothetical protein [Crassaminicella profunda]|uniref:hypothetical protein n=1 Tax=Crassaminicella profunda TaxID=1286698 RepID=UPI001CA70E48|nr:hypothetical protein [Crassaminicella profunda]QZY54550.1 hypothetical protein K7H06_16135 [Crassaminicella profunda]
MEVLKKINDLEFKVVEGFNIKYLEPIVLNMLWKMKNNWDDYNEVYHCCQLMESIQKTDDAWIHTHMMKKREEVVGVVFIEGGKIDFNHYLKVKINNEVINENNVMLNYFHIAPDARGNGYKWLSQMIIPHYKNKGIKNIFLKSSHEKSFSLYRRLGSEIGCYTTKSDNQLYTREGKVFQIKI